MSRLAIQQDNFSTCNPDRVEKATREQANSYWGTLVEEGLPVGRGTGDDLTKYDDSKPPVSQHF